MGCMNCGRDLHAECARSNLTEQCCGLTSLCEPRNSNDLQTQDSTLKTGSRGSGPHRSLPEASQPDSGSRQDHQHRSRRDSNDSITGLDFDLEQEQTGRIGRPHKVDNFLDAESTGRKRAAELYPLDKEADCEWRQKANVGGGRYPIVGCLDGKQTNRHHGPDKNTLNNKTGNVHRICARCHNLWHEWNDADIAEDTLHQPRMAEVAELIQWSDRRTRPKAPNSRYKWHRERANAELDNAEELDD